MRLRPAGAAAAAAIAMLAGALAMAGCSAGTGAGSAAVRARHGACSTVVSNAGMLQSVVSAAARGDVVCLADGSFGPLDLRGRQPVVVRAEHPGRATIGEVHLAGSDLTLARFDVEGDVLVQAGARRVAIRHNRIRGGYFGIDACDSDSTPCDDVSIVGNQLVGPYGEDAIRANRYHDGNGDGIGLLVEGNEITGVRENGNHSDCMQTVWVGDHLVFRRNYLHDNRCQGLFVKDQASAIHGIRIEDNLFLRDSAPCAPVDPGCGQSNYLNLYGPYSHLVMSRNTVWGDEPTAAFRTPPGPRTVVRSNVFQRLWTDADFSAATLRNNTVCRMELGPGGRWPASQPGRRHDCRLPFRDPGSDDFRLGDGRGVNWAPGNQHYGP